MDYTLIENLAASILPPDDGILSKKVYEDDHLKVVAFGFGPGEELSEHTASMSAIMHFVNGTSRVKLGDEERTLGENAWVHMAPNLKHTIVAETPVTMLLLLLKQAK